MTSPDHDPVEMRTFAALDSALPRVTPAAALLDRILEEVRAEGTVVPIRSRRWVGRRFVASAAVAAAAVLVVSVGTWSLTRSSSGPDARAAIAGKSEPAVRGQAQLYDLTGADARVLVSLRSVPRPPSGHHYEIWVLREGTAAMESLGSFVPTSSEVELSFPLPGSGPYVAVDVSIEDDGGPPGHSGTSLASGSFS